MLVQEGKTGFIGFGGLSEATGNSFGYVPKLSGTTDEADHEIDPELRMLLRKMTKKDTTTKLKVSEEFHWKRPSLSRLFLSLYQT